MINKKSQVCNLPILEDKTSTGKIRPWSDKKKANVTLEKIYRSLSLDTGDYYSAKANRLHDCASYLLFDVLSPDDLSHLKLNHMSSCRVRLCPMCAWRRTLKISSHAMKIFSYIETDMEYKDKYTYLFLTLTVPNCTGNKLSITIDLLMSAWKRLMERKEVKAVVKGWYRGLEVTHNHNPISSSYDTYHPHFHCVLVVNKSYVTQHNSKVGYITHERWVQLWSESLGLFVTSSKKSFKKRKLSVNTYNRPLTLNEQKALVNEYSKRCQKHFLCRAEVDALINNIPNKRKLAVKNTCSVHDWFLLHDYDKQMLSTAKRLMLQVDIRTIKAKHKNHSCDVLEKSGLINAICEVTKYTVKDKDYILPWNWELSQDIVATLDNALDRRRLIAWGGLLAKVRDKLTLDDEIDGDLVHIDDEKENVSAQKLQLLAVWNVGYQQYFIADVFQSE